MREHKAEVLNSPNGNSVKGVNGVHTLALALPPKSGHTEYKIRSVYI